MAQRYGRKRRRQHRERIAALEREATEIAAQRNRAQAEAARLDYEMREWDEEIRRLLGPQSAFRCEVAEICSPHPIREMPIMDRLRPFDMGDSVLMETPPRERIRRFVLTIERDDMRLKRLIRFMETDGRGGVAYSISEEAARLGWGRREIQYIAQSVAENMVGHFNDHLKTK